MMALHVLMQKEIQDTTDLSKLHSNDNSFHLKLYIKIHTCVRHVYICVCICTYMFVYIPITSNTHIDKNSEIVNVTSLMWLSKRKDALYQFLKCFFLYNEHFFYSLKKQGIRI